VELLNLLKLIKKYIIFIICACVVTTLLSGWISINFIKNVYQTSCMMIIGNDISSSSSGTLNYDDYNLNVDLVNSYRVLCKTNSILQKVLDKTKLQLTVSELASEITVNSENNTELISITVENSNALTAEIIANSVAEVFESEIPIIMKVNNVQIVDYARIPTSPTSPNRKFIVLLSLFGCILFCSLVIAAREYLDFTVKSEDQLESIAECPVLASVPHTQKNILL
jgi:capsular polysaccharide biosynthesis protein